jgi:CheY-like chemotaxis protein
MSTPAKKILVVDDEELLTRTFVLLLERHGYDVLVAKTGLDAIALAEEYQFDAIICDVRMPGMDGVKTIEKIREIYSARRHKQALEFLVSGYADESVLAKAKVLQVKEIFSKPFDNQSLLEKLQQGLSA